MTQTTTVDERSWTDWACSGAATPTDRRNGRIMNTWLAVWMAVYVASTWLMESRGEESLAISTGGLAATALFAIPAYRAFLRFIREADEMTRMIQIKAMAVGFGAGVLVGILENFLERVVALSSIPDMLDFFNPMIVMILTYTFATLILQRSYAR